MLTPGTPAPIERDEALRLLDELTDVQARLERLRSGLRALVDEDADAQPPRSSSEQTSSPAARNARAVTPSPATRRRRNEPS